MQKNLGFATRSFAGRSGGTEHFICIQPPPTLSWAEQIETVIARYDAARRSLGLSAHSAIFRRLFVSDALNQAAPLVASALCNELESGPVAVSMVQQQPLPAGKIALFAYHIDDRQPVEKRRLSPNHLLVDKSGLRHLWSTRLCAGAADSFSSPAMQTGAVFEELIAALGRCGATLRDNCMRTWIYLKDVDVFYQGMVESRRALFARQGLTGDSHFIASTGIEGACAHRFDIVALDAYSVLGLAPQQVSYLNDFERLCATKEYNVTFERGTRIAYADRAHHLISGTASIDGRGRILYEGDLVRQLHRALENVDALLRSGSASLDDMMYLIVYLRDPADFARIDRELRAHFPELPVLIVQGAVCRPGWLVEVEGLAIAANDAPGLASF
jgi:enamine deaminase RidA (YjgF/YER057c/UK114 family)